jgi:hypothetical protein
MVFLFFLYLFVFDSTSIMEDSFISRRTGQQKGPLADHMQNFHHVNKEPFCALYLEEACSQGHTLILGVYD